MDAPWGPDVNAFGMPSEDWGAEKKKKKKSRRSHADDESHASEHHQHHHDHHHHDHHDHHDHHHAAEQEHHHHHGHAESVPAVSSSFDLGAELGTRGRDEWHRHPGQREPQRHDGHLGGRRTERGFSFSLTDLPDAPWAADAARRREAFAAAHATATPRSDVLGLATAKPRSDAGLGMRGVWNPLTHVSSNWDPALASTWGGERRPFPLDTPHRAPRAASREPFLSAPPTATPPAAAAAAAASAWPLEEELWWRERRAHELRDRIAMLEAMAEAAAAAGYGPRGGSRLRSASPVPHGSPPRSPPPPRSSPPKMPPPAPPPASPPPPPKVSGRRVRWVWWPCCGTEEQQLGLDDVEYTTTKVVVAGNGDASHDAADGEVSVGQAYADERAEVSRPGHPPRVGDFSHDLVYC